MILSGSIGLNDREICVESAFHPSRPRDLTAILFMFDVNTPVYVSELFSATASPFIYQVYPVGSGPTSKLSTLKVYEFPGTRHVILEIEATFAGAICTIAKQLSFELQVLAHTSIVSIYWILFSGRAKYVNWCFVVPGFCTHPPLCGNSYVGAISGTLFSDN